jgi:hypothetical protein
MILDYTLALKVSMSVCKKERPEGIDIGLERESLRSEFRHTTVVLDADLALPCGTSYIRTPQSTKGWKPHHLLLFTAESVYF